MDFAITDHPIAVHFMMQSLPLHHCIFNIPVLLAFPADCAACSLSPQNSIQFPESIRPTGSRSKGFLFFSMRRGSCYQLSCNIKQFTDSWCIKIKSFSCQNTNSGWDFSGVSSEFWEALNVTCWMFHIFDGEWNGVTYCPKLTVRRTKRDKNCTYIVSLAN